MCFFVSKGLGRRRITALKRRYPEKICINQIKSLTLQRKKKRRFLWRVRDTYIILRTCDNNGKRIGNPRHSSGK